MPQEHGLAYAALGLTGRLASIHAAAAIGVAACKNT
jgi:hypothetical protein